MNDEVIVYQPDEATRIEPRVNEDAVWLTQKQIAELFGRNITTIRKHLKNAESEELAGFSVGANFALTAADGKSYSVKHYNLDAVLSVGYRVKSPRGIQFRRWANKVLTERILKRHTHSSEIAALEERIKKLEIAALEVRVGNLESRIYSHPRVYRPYKKGAKAREFAKAILSSGDTWTIGRASEQMKRGTSTIWRYLKQLEWHAPKGVITPCTTNGVVL